MNKKYTSMQSGMDFVKGIYQNDSCRLRGRKITIEDLKPLIGKSKTFQIQDCFGDWEEVTFTIQNVVETRYHFEYYVKASSYVPERQCPTIYQIVKDLYEIGERYISEEEKCCLDIEYMPENMKRLIR